MDHSLHAASHLDAVAIECGTTLRNPMLSSNSASLGAISLK
jgi:hypothetical protein